MMYHCERIEFRTPMKPMAQALQINLNGVWVQTFTPPDQRKIGFAPSFIFHGAPGCRYDSIAFHDKGKLLGVRLICPDRPGHGYSSPKPNRILSEYASDVSALAKHVNITGYDVLGISSGGPCVAASQSSSKPILRHATICAGFGSTGLDVRPTSIVPYLESHLTVCPKNLILVVHHLGCSRSG